MLVCPLPEIEVSLGPSVLEICKCRSVPFADCQTEIHQFRADRDDISVGTHHHLLDHRPCLTIKIRQLRVFGLDLCGVDFGMMGEDVGPPLMRLDVC